MRAIEGLQNAGGSRRIGENKGEGGMGEQQHHIYCGVAELEFETRVV
jgi:hypothetical protein